MVCRGQSSKAFVLTSTFERSTGKSASNLTATQENTTKQVEVRLKLKVSQCMLTLASNYMLIAGAASGVIFSCEELLSRSQWNLLSEKEHSHLRRTHACETKQSASMPLHPHPQQNANRKRSQETQAMGCHIRVCMGLYGIFKLGQWPGTSLSDHLIKIKIPIGSSVSQRSLTGGSTVFTCLTHAPSFPDVPLAEWLWSSDSGYWLEGVRSNTYCIEGETSHPSGLVPYPLLTNA